MCLSAEQGTYRQRGVAFVGVYHEPSPLVTGPNRRLGSRALYAAQGRCKLEEVRWCRASLLLPTCERCPPAARRAARFLSPSSDELSARRVDILRWPDGA